MSFGARENRVLIPHIDSPFRFISFQPTLARFQTPLDLAGCSRSLRVRRGDGRVVGINGSSPESSIKLIASQAQGRQ